MALKDLLALADDKLHEVFSRKPHDPAKARNAFIKRIDTTENQFKSATPVRGRKIFKIANGVVQVTLPFEIAGKSTFHVPSERFSDWLGHLRDSVSKGELDKELETPPATSTAPKVGTRADAGRKRGPLSPEALEARRQKMAAKKK